MPAFVRGSAGVPRSPLSPPIYHAALPEFEEPVRRIRQLGSGMKILNVIATVDPAAGGTVEGLLRLSEVLEEAGHQIELMTLDRADAPWLARVKFPVHAMGPGTRRYGYCPGLVPWLRAHREEYDIAVLHGIWNYSSFGAFRGLAHGAVPYAIFTHGMLDPWFRKAYPLKHWAKQLYWLMAEGRVLQNASRVLFTAKDEEELARGGFYGYRYRSDVVGLGTADPPAPSSSQERAWRALLPQLADRRYLLFLSRIHPKKGCDILLEAFTGLADRHPDLDLVIAGPDQLGWRDDLEARFPMLRGRVHWPGMVDGDAKWGAFRGAEAFVLPSHQENFGIVVAEAMACETPVLITDKINIWREVEASGGGFVGQDTVEGVTGLLQRFLALAPQQRLSMGSKARVGFLEHFEIRKAAKNLLEVLDQIRTDRRCGSPSASADGC